MTVLDDLGSVDPWNCCLEAEISVLAVALMSQSSRHVENTGASPLTVTVF